MLTNKFAITGLIWIQFAFLVSALGDAWIATYDPSAHVPPHAFVFLISHMVSLGVLLRLINRSRRRETQEFANLRRQLEGSVRQAEDLIQCSSDLVWETDATGRFTFVFDHKEVQGGACRVIRGSTVQELAAQDPLTPFDAWQKQSESNKRGEPFRDFRYCLKLDDGSITHFAVNGVPVRDAKGMLVGFRGLSRDCTQEVELLERMSRSLLTDPLTGLANRRALRNWLYDAGVAVPDHPAPRQTDVVPFAYLLVDLDGFKAVNDLYGHVAGDEVLVVVARRLMALLGTSDCCARIGGDEFAIALHEGDEAKAFGLGQAIVDAMSEPARLSGGECARFGASVGISFCVGPGMNAQKLFRAADRALYEVKHRGGGAFRTTGEEGRDSDTSTDPIEREPATPQAAARERNEAVLLRDLRKALAGDQFHVVFQPIVSADTNRVMAHEALLRWTHPEIGNIPPSHFIPLAERSGLIVSIGQHVLMEACRIACKVDAEWAVTVNMSAFQFAQDDIVTQVLDAITSTGLPPSRLILELTEQSLVADKVEVRTRMRALRAAGVRLALDDFGAGFANVSYLREFQFDIVKIDRAILLFPEHQRIEILSALLQITRSFGIPTIVEGIETLEDWKLAKGLGSNAIQGYYIGRPSATFIEVSENDASCELLNVA